MGEAVKDLGVTLVFVGLAYAGGRKLDGYLMGIYGGSYCASHFVQWLYPTVDKFNNWLAWCGSMFGKVNDFFG